MGRKTFVIDWLIVLPLIVLALCGFVAIVSSTSSLFVPQLSFIIVGLIVYFALSHTDYTIFKHFWIVWYVCSIILLLVTLLGPEVRGATRWLDIGVIRVQPSELVKPLLILSFAAFFIKRPVEKLSSLVQSGILFVFPTGLLFLQPDLGNVLVYSAFFFGLLLMAGIPSRTIMVILLVIGIAIPLSFPYLKEYQKLRITTFFSPSQDPQGNGYNALQSKIAVGSGGLWGRGFGRGVQSHLRFLPENHTDFIFASFVEEFGFVGGSIIVMLQFFLLWQILHIVQNNNAHQFVRLFCAGCFIQLAFQVLVNVGMNMGLVPITGITLPLVSYGGSSFIATCIELGIITSMKSRLDEVVALAIH